LPPGGDRGTRLGPAGPGGKGGVIGPKLALLHDELLEEHAHDEPGPVLVQRPHDVGL
jgi:hypothetical protein